MAERQGEAGTANQVEAVEDGSRQQLGGDVSPSGEARRDATRMASRAPHRLMNVEMVAGGPQVAGRDLSCAVSPDGKRFLVFRRDSDNSRPTLTSR